MSIPAPEDWRERLAIIVDTMRDMSRQTDPQQMVRTYAERMRALVHIDRRLSLSRRGLETPAFRITRSTTWERDINPWKEKDRLPVLSGGLLSRLIYGDEPVVIDDLVLEPGEPAAEYLAGHRSLLAIPMYDQGVALNMVILLDRNPHAFPKEDIPDLVWRSNLFGRATSNLVLQDELRQAYVALDREFRVVGEIQRSLLPAELPRIETLDLAAYYQPAQRAGGDYYDCFPLPGGQCGLFIADVSGHGTPAAVLMAVTHCIAHTHPGPPMPPGNVLAYINKHLSRLYTGAGGHFVTALYAVYDPIERRLTYSSAGHNPPRLKRCSDGSLLSLDGAGGFPLGLTPDIEYGETTLQLQRGDQIIFYTDGITEAQNPDGQLFGIERLDAVLENCAVQARGLLDTVLEALEQFTRGKPADDDRTMIVTRVT